MGFSREEYWSGLLCPSLASLVAQMVKRLPAMWETWVWSLGHEDPLEKEMATHFSTLACKIKDRGAWCFIVHGVAKGRTWLNNFIFFSFFLYPSPGYLFQPRSKLVSLMSPALAGEFFTTSATCEGQNFKRRTRNTLSLVFIIKEWKSSPPFFLFYGGIIFP